MKRKVVVEHHCDMCDALIGKEDWSKKLKITSRDYHIHFWGVCLDEVEIGRYSVEVCMDCYGAFVTHFMEWEKEMKAKRNRGKGD